MGFEQDFQFTMDDEDPAQDHAIVSDAPDQWKTDSAGSPVLDDSGKKIRIGAWAISGINSASYPKQFAAIAALPQAQRGPAIEDFYQTEFFNKYEDQISDLVEERVFNMAVNAGMGTAVKLLQKAVNSLGGNLAVDGAWGPATVAAANFCDQDALLNAYRAQRLQRYKDIAAKHPEYAKYLGTADKPGVWWIRAMR